MKFLVISFRGTKVQAGGGRVRLPDCTVQLPRKDGSTTTVTHQFIMKDFVEIQGVKTVEGQTYSSGDAGDERRVIGTISGVFFVTHEIHESLQMAADGLTQELYDAMETLFAYNGGSPKGTFKKKTNDDVFAGILYIKGEFVNKDQRGQGLGLEIVRALIQSLDECDLVLLCPAADPHPGPHAWNYAFDSLSAMFEKLGFQRCGGKNRRSGQSKFMFLEPLAHDLEPPPVKSQKKVKVMPANP